jgi:transcriptional regulator with XRE-family HTH domain
MPTPFEIDDDKLREAITIRINELFTLSGLNQAQFALEIGMDKQNLSALLKGKGAGIQTILRVSKQAGITLKDFFDSPLFKDI